MANMITLTPEQYDDMLKVHEEALAHQWEVANALRVENQRLRAALAKYEACGSVVGHTAKEATSKKEKEIE